MPFSFCTFSTTSGGGGGEKCKSEKQRTDIEAEVSKDLVFVSLICMQSANASSEAISIHFRRVWQRMLWMGVNMRVYPLKGGVFEFC